MKCCTQELSRQTALYNRTAGFSVVTWLPGTESCSEMLSKHRVYSRSFSEAQGGLQNWAEPSHTSTPSFLAEALVGGTLSPCSAREAPWLSSSQLGGRGAQVQVQLFRCRLDYAVIRCFTTFLYGHTEPTAGSFGRRASQALAGSRQHLYPLVPSCPSQHTPPCRLAAHSPASYTVGPSGS